MVLEQLSIVGAVITEEVEIQPGNIFLSNSSAHRAWVTFSFSLLCQGICKSLWHLPRDPGQVLEVSRIWRWQRSPECHMACVLTTKDPEALGQSQGKQHSPVGVCRSAGHPLITLQHDCICETLTSHDKETLVFIHEFDITCVYVEPCQNFSQVVSGVFFNLHWRMTCLERGGRETLISCLPHVL